MAYAFIDLRSLRGLQPKQVSWCQIYRARSWMVLGGFLSRSNFNSQEDQKPRVGLFKGRVHISHFRIILQ